MSLVDVMHLVELAFMALVSAVVNTRVLRTELKGLKERIEGVEKQQGESRRRIDHLWERA